MPELPECEITAVLLDRALAGATIESALAPGVNALKTFDPPLSALGGATIAAVRRRGKLLIVDVQSPAHGSLSLLMHLMSAGRLQLYSKRATLKDRTSRVLLRLDGDRELRLREFGTKQAAWARLLTADGLAADETLAGLGPEAWPKTPGPAALAQALTAGGARPLHSVLRDQHVITGIGRTWVDEILNVAGLSPFKRGDDLTEPEAAALSAAIASEMRRVIDHYVATVSVPIPDKLPKPTRVHAHQGEPCPRCGTALEAVHFEDYVMSYCPPCQTGGRVLKDRRMSRLLK